jgi:septal ring-binding cell division protein DamX
MPQTEQVDVSGPRSTIMQAKQKDDAYDLKQIFNVEQMPETPTSANTTLDSAVQRTQATIDAQQPAASQAVLQQQAAGQTQASSQPAATQPIQDSKPQSSPEERPAGEATTTTNPEAEANPTPDWLVPKIFKGGSLG